LAALTSPCLTQGILISGEITQFAVEKWSAVIRVNLIGYLLVCIHTANVTKQQRSGCIIQINSKSGKRRSFENSPDAASKFGGIGLTQSVALELTEFGVCVDAGCLGSLLDTPMWVDSLYDQYSKRWGTSEEEEVQQRYIDQVPMKRACTYDDVGNVVVFLASDQSTYMTRQATNVTGGQEIY
jgi:sorbitol-6-phosphate 2-dehydrogenase